jgi:hypothetical protein
VRACRLNFLLAGYGRAAPHQAAIAA